MMSVSSHPQLGREQSEQRRARKHPTTIKRRWAFTLAILIPIGLWSMSGFMISRTVFELDAWSSAWVSIACGLTISIVEGIVILSPKSPKVTAARMVIGLVMAALGAATVDLVIFDREVTAQLIENAKTRVGVDYDNRIRQQQEEVRLNKADWDRKLASASCEGDGTCGSRQRNLGPRYMALKKEADDAKSAYRQAGEGLLKLKEMREAAIGQISEHSKEVKSAGLIDRLTALHQRIFNSAPAMVVFSLFLILILALELMVLSVKLVFGETIDDKKEEIMATLEESRVKDYLAALTSSSRHPKYLFDRTLS